MKFKVEGHSTLIKDEFTHAVINDDTVAYRKYMQSVRLREKQTDQMRTVVREINTLKADMREIKSLLKGIVNGRLEQYQQQIH